MKTRTTAHIMKSAARRLLLLPLLAVSLQTHAQTAYKGQLFINSESFTRQGDMLRVRMKVSYDRSAVDSGESLTFTPVLKTLGSSVRLSSVVINGDRREKAENRADVLSGRRRSNVPVVVRDSHAGELYFIYDTTVPYEEWMHSAALYTESEECNCNGHAAHVFEDRIMKAIPFGNTAVSSADPVTRNYDILPCVEFVQPSAASTETYTASGVIPLYDAKRIGRMSERRFNRTVSGIIRDDIRRQLSQGGASIDAISVHGYGAPAGSYSLNEKSAMQRALSLKRGMMKNRLTSSNALGVTWTAEDWDSISVLTAASSMSLKDAVCNIIRAVEVVNGRENEIKLLDHGVPYRFMQAAIFPRVCRVEYTLTVRRRSLDAESGILMLKNNPSQMSLSDLYAVAQNYNVGSREFNDIIDLSARLFPESAEAGINAAGVALIRGDVKLARKYLSRRMTDSRAYNNIGVMYMMAGNRDKAEVYLNMAKAQGVSQADEAMKQLGR